MTRNHYVPSTNHQYHHQHHQHQQQLQQHQQQQYNSDRYQPSPTTFTDPRRYSSEMSDSHHTYDCLAETEKHRYNSMLAAGTDTYVSPIERSEFQTEYQTQYSNYEHSYNPAPVDHGKDRCRHHRLKMAKTTHDFCQESSLHGIQYIGNPNVNKYRR